MSDRKRHRSRSPPKESYSHPRWDHSNWSNSVDFYQEFNQDSHHQQDVELSSYQNHQNNASFQQQQKQFDHFGHQNHQNNPSLQQEQKQADHFDYQNHHDNASFQQEQKQLDHLGYQNHQHNASLQQQQKQFDHFGYQNHQHNASLQQQQKQFDHFSHQNHQHNASLKQQQKQADDFSHQNHQNNASLQQQQKQADDFSHQNHQNNASLQQQQQQTDHCGYQNHQNNASLQQQQKQFDHFGHQNHQNNSSFQQQQKQADDYSHQNHEHNASLQQQQKQFDHFGYHNHQNNAQQQQEQADHFVYQNTSFSQQEYAERDSSLNDHKNTKFYEQHNNSDRGYNRGGFNKKGGSRGGFRGNQSRGDGRGNVQLRSGMEPSAGGSKQFNREKNATQNVDPTKLSLAERIQQLCLFLQTFAEKENQIMTLEHAILSSKLPLEPKFECSVLFSVKGSHIFTGCLHIDSRFIVRAVGRTKMEVKRAVYKETLDILKNKSVEDIMGLVDNLEDLKIEYSQGLKAEPSASTETLKEKNLSHQEFSVSLRLLIYSLEMSGLPGENSISALEQAISMSHLPLQTDCIFEEGQSPDKKAYFRARLYLNTTLIALGHGRKKKECKHNAYDNAIVALTTRTAENLESGVAVEGSNSENSWETLNITPLPGFDNVNPQSKMKTESKKSAPSVTAEDCFVELITRIKTSYFNGMDIAYLGDLSYKLNMNPVCIYRKSPNGSSDVMDISCALYMVNIFIAAGESKTQKEAQMNAFQKAVNFLLCTTAAAIVAEQPKMPTTDPSDPDILEIVYIGIKTSMQSNLDLMKSLQIEQSTDPLLLEKMVIMEDLVYSMDRENHAFIILMESASANGILMEWNLSSVQHGQMYRCSVFLQNTKVAEAKHRTKKVARKKACGIALSNFYKSQPVIQVDSKFEPRFNVSWNNILQEIDYGRYYGRFERRCNRTNDATEHCMFTCMIRDYVQSDSIDTIAVACGAPKTVLKELTQRARELNLKTEAFMGLDGEGIAVTKKVTPTILVECLKRNSYKSGKYTLLKIAERPTLDVEENSDVELEETSDMELVETSDMGLKETSDMGLKESSDMGLKETSDMGLEETSDMGLEETSDMELVETSDMGPKETSDMGLEETSDMELVETSDVELEVYDSTLGHGTQFDDYF